MSVSTTPTQSRFTRTQSVLLKAIAGYQWARAGRLSPCRFYPSCSHYAVEAIETHGSLRGVAFAIRRLSRCRPFGPSGIDLVPAPQERV